MSATNSKHQFARLNLLPLEDRTTPAAFMVTNLNAAGPGSFAQAILNANANPGPDSIAFNTALFGTAQALALSSTLPTIAGPTAIVGPGSNLLTLISAPVTTPFTALNLGAGQNASISGMTVLGNSGLSTFQLGADVRDATGLLTPGGLAAGDFPSANSTDVLGASVMALRFSPDVSFTFGGDSVLNTLDPFNFQGAFGASIP